MIVNWGIRAGGVLLAVVSLAEPVTAGEYCVTCEGPAAMYACVIEGALADAPPDPRAQVSCIQELARLGGHETCSVPRSAPKPCPGVVRTVAAPSSGISTPDDGHTTAPITEPSLAAQENRQPGVAPEQPRADQPAAELQEPKTVEELAAQTVEASKQGLKKAGDAVTGTAQKAGDSVEKAGSAVGSAAKKTWECLKSIFSDC